MARDQDIGITMSLRGGEHGIKNRDGTPIRKEMPLLRVRLREATEIEPIVDGGGEVEVIVWARYQASTLVKIHGPLSFFQHRRHREVQATGL